MELITTIPQHFQNNTKLQDLVQRDIPPRTAKATAFVVQRVGFRRPTDADHLRILLSACDYSRRLSLVRFLFDYFEMNHRMVSRIGVAMENAGNLASLVWGGFLDPDRENDDPQDRYYARRRTDRSQTETALGYERWRDATIASFTTEEANLDAYRPTTDDLREVFGLDANEREVVLALFALYEIPVRREVFLPDDLRSITSAVSRMTGIDSSTIEKIIHPNGRLVRFKLISVDLRVPTEYDLKVETILVNLFRGYITKESLLENIQLVGTANFPLGSFPLEKRDRQAVRGLIRSPKPRHILVYGEPGTGKTELVRSIIRAERKKAYWIGAVDKDVDEDSGSRHSLLEIATAMAKERDAVLVVDEADQLLNTESLFGSSGKARLVRVFDETAVTTVWIVNDADGVHNAIARRFHFHLRFEPPRKDVRFQRLSMLLRRADIPLPPAARRRIAESYDVSIASLSRAVETALEASGTDVVELLEQTLAYEHEFVHGAKPSTHARNRQAISHKRFLQDAINTSVPVSRVATAVTRFFDAQDRDGGRSGALNVLFSGPSGTGKTAFAQELAHIVGRKLLFVTGSDLLRPHVGETEMAIQKMFSEATLQRAIILLDEAENLLQSRNTALTGHERQHTNEFLSQMERHGTVCIATTNEEAIIDAAMARRFALKVAFAPPVAKHRPALYRAYFTLPHRRLSPALATRIEAIDGLTPGHVRTLYDRLQFFLDDHISHHEIIEELETEVATTLHDRSEPVVLGFTA